MTVKYLKYIPLQEFVKLGLSANQILFCSIVMSFYKGDKKLRAGYRNIEEALPCTGKTIERDADKLSVLGLINIKSGYAEKNANEYTPTPKLIGLYRQNVSINTDKMSTHTPSKEGYNRETDADALARRHGFTEEYASDQKLFGIDNAKARLNQRIAIKQKQTI